MNKKHFLFILLVALTLTACSQAEILLPILEEVVAHPTMTRAVPSLSPTPEAPSATAPTVTASLTPSPSRTHTPKPTRTPRATETATATMPAIIRIGPDDFPDYVNPLTGLTMINPALLERRPIAVKIPNYPHNVYPQSGLSAADHIYEYHLEQGITRFIAIFYGNDAPRVGPVRSGRVFDAHIVQMYNAVFVFNYAYHEEGNESLDVYGYLEKTLNKNLFVVDPGDCTDYMCRDESLHTYNNLFANTYGITQLINERGQENGRQDLASNYFNSLGGRGKNLVSRIYINYSYANYAYWAYQKESQRYYRYQGNVDQTNGQGPEYILLTDANNNQPIAADNVVILMVPHDFRYKSSTDMSEVFDINLIDSGEAYVFRSGSVFEARWERKDTNKPLSILNPDGSSFPLRPGVTFFQVFHTTSGISHEGDVWDFTFERPEEE